MKLAPRRRLTLIGVSLALLALGAGVASQVSDALGLQSQPSVGIPVENLTVAPASTVVLPPAFTAIEAPDDLRVSTAVDELRDAVADAGTTSGTATLTVSFDSVEASGEGYSVSGTPTDIRISAASRSGAVLGVYDLAAAVRDGRSVIENLGRPSSRRCPSAWSTSGRRGAEPDAAAYAAGTDYSHNSIAFKDVILADAPYIDDAALARATTEFEEYVRHTSPWATTPSRCRASSSTSPSRASASYRGVRGRRPHRARAEAMRDGLRAMLDYAPDLGLKVYFRTDMLALTTPLAGVLRAQRFGGLDTDEPRVLGRVPRRARRALHRDALVDGVVVRIGEAGRVYDLPGWDYYSELAVTIRGFGSRDAHGLQRSGRVVGQAR